MTWSAALLASAAGAACGNDSDGGGSSNDGGGTTSGGTGSATGGRPSGGSGGKATGGGGTGGSTGKATGGSSGGKAVGGSTQGGADEGGSTGDGGKAVGGANPEGGEAGAATGGTGGAEQGGASTGGSAGAAPASTCPEAEPTQDAPCEPLGLRCTYGDHPNFSCRTAARCIEAGWEVRPPAVELGCDEDPLPAGCPDEPGDGSCAGQEELGCFYPGGPSCTCTNCPSGSPVCNTQDDYAWDCLPSPPEPCPTFPPNTGTACSLGDGEECRYSCAIASVCDGGLWEEGPFQCPRCNSPDTPVATPDGERAIASLGVGDLVYSVEEDGVVVVPIARVTAVPARRHSVLRLVLASGARLEISASHPTADGRTLAELAPGDALDGVRVVSIEPIPFVHSHTFDILPDSASGTYFAGGVLLGSTLTLESAGSAEYGGARWRTR